MNIDYRVLPLIDPVSRHSFLIKKSRYYNPNIETLSLLVMNAINEKLSIPQDVLKSVRRYRDISEARHIYCYIMREKYRCTTVSIGKFIERDHVTVICSCRAASNLKETDAEFKRKLELVLDAIN